MKIVTLAAAVALCAPARELHVSPAGPYRTISAAAQEAQPGDVITVHAGTYRERVTPPRGGESDAKRIVYQAAPGETVILKGSEVVTGWTQFVPGVWKVTLPNTMFGAYNPYKDLIVGDWFTDKGRPHHTGEVYLNGKSLWETHLLEKVLVRQAHPTWFAEVDEKNTYIYANFHDRNPNQELVEINVRPTCFYPDKPGRDYITVRGFRMAHAATQWAAPTAEQIALLGTHWSKGWIIENNVISDSKCTGISLGKDRATGHNVWINDPRKDGATHYNEVILRALNAGWSRETIGSHVVRNNVIFDCEQAGIVGSLGAVFSHIANNHIYGIWAKRQFTGAEMAGIKLHGAIDVVIEKNRIHGSGRGIWLDWMAQGTRVTGNVLYDNSTDDLFVEVNHGPFVVDGNLFLSGLSLRDWSEGGAYVHNLLAGRIESRPEPTRSTPYHKAHSTALGGLNSTTGGDNRFYNNIFSGKDDCGLWVYNHREFPLFTGGNVYVGGARPWVKEADALRVEGGAGPPEMVEEGDRVFLKMTLPAEMRGAKTVAVHTGMLGAAKVSGLGYENADGTPLNLGRTFPGPLENPGTGQIRVRVW